MSRLTAHQMSSDTEIFDQIVCVEEAESSAPSGLVEGNQDHLSHREHGTPRYKSRRALPYRVPGIVEIRSRGMLSQAFGLLRPGPIGGPLRHRAGELIEDAGPREAHQGIGEVKRPAKPSSAKYACVRNPS